MSNSNWDDSHNATTNNASSDQRPSNDTGESQLSSFTSGGNPTGTAMPVTDPTPETPSPYQAAPFCPQCGNAVEADAMFCGSCGSPLSGGTSTAPTAAVSPTYPASPSFPTPQSYSIAQPQPQPQFAEVPNYTVPTRTETSGTGEIQFGSWLLDSLKRPFAGRSAADNVWFSWISIISFALLSAGILATAASKAASGVASASSGLFSSLNLSSESSQSLINAGHSMANAGITRAFFGVSIGFIVVALAMVLCVWMVRHSFLGDSNSTFSTTMDMVGRQLIVVNVVLLVAELFTLMGAMVMTVLAEWLVLILLGTIVNFGIFQGANYRGHDEFYIKLGGALLSGLIIGIAVIILMALGLSTLMGSF